MSLTQCCHILSKSTLQYANPSIPGNDEKVQLRVSVSLDTDM
jgi:hypothetical protein